MNTRIATSIIVLAVLSLGAGLAPLQAAQAQKPARFEVREQTDDAHKGTEQRGRQARPVKNGSAPAAGPRPATVRQDDRARRDDRRHDDHDDRRHDDRDDRSQDRTPSTYRPAWRHDGGSRYRYDDSRHRDAYVRHDDRRSHTYHHYPSRRYYYPPRGYVAPVLPRNVVVVRHRHYNYWYGGGVWYRPYGTRYVVVAPPPGVFVPALPSFYSTLWFGGVPYYYANNTYYAWREPQRAYEVVAPPAGAPTAAVDPVTEDIFAYPREGQDEEQVAYDRYECHRWASDGTGFDPTQPWGGVSEGQAGALRDAYLRAMTACLDGRGYTVR